jgi:hypothetical protein
MMMTTKIVKMRRRQRMRTKMTRKRFEEKSLGLTCFYKNVGVAACPLENCDANSLSRVELRESSALLIEFNFE